MSDALFHDRGREAGNELARQFERRLTCGLAPLARWQAVASNVDALLPQGRRSRGLDGIWANLNPRTGRGDGWIVEFKRHGDPGRYSPRLLGDELATLQAKVGLLHSRGAAFYDDAQFSDHIKTLAGGMLFHHCRGFSGNSVRRLLRDLDLQNRVRGPRPPRLLFIGPDDVGGLAAAAQRFGAPSEFWWPSTSNDRGIWHDTLSPEQLAVGMVIMRTAEHGRILLLRETLERRDVQAVADLVWHFGDNVDVVACAQMRPEQAQHIHDAWRQAVRRCASRPHGRLPDTVEALNCAEPVAAFEQVFTEDGLLIPAAAPRGRRRRQQADGPPPLPGELSAHQRRQATIDYPSRLAVQRTVDSKKATLRGTLAYLAGEGVVVAADEKQGAAIAAGEIWPGPAATRRMSELLEADTQPTVSGLRLLHAPVRPTLPALERHAVFDDIAEACDGLVGQPFGDQHVRLRGHDRADGPWPLTLDLVFDDALDLVGERVPLEGRATVLIRPVSVSEADVCLLSDQPSGRRAARRWITDALQLAAREWRRIEVTLPTSEPQRTAVLEDVIDATTAGRTLGVDDPRGFRSQRRSTPLPVAGEDADALREIDAALFGIRLDIDIVSPQAVFARARADHVALGELTAYGEVALPDGPPVIAKLRARQRPSDASLSLTWIAGRCHTERTRDHRFCAGVWAEMRPRACSLETKRMLLAERWGELVDRIRTHETRDADQQRRSA